MTKSMIVTWLVGGGAALIASAAVRALPEPAPNGNQAYLWAYKTIHFLLANFDKSSGAGK